jgi:hypothetical protein
MFPFVISLALSVSAVAVGVVLTFLPYRLLVRDLNSNRLRNTDASIGLFALKASLYLLVAGLFILAMGFFALLFVLPFTG